MLSTLSSPLAFAPAMAPTMAPTRAMPVMQTKEELATALNPAVGYFDPMGLGSADFWSVGNEATYGFLRHAEIKHGRVAMAAFVGYIVQSNFVFPWSLTFGGVPHPGTDLSPPEQWDALPTAAKVQVIAFVGFLEWYSELSDNDNGPHYTKGGKPGQYPTFDNI